MKLRAKKNLIIPLIILLLISIHGLLVDVKSIDSKKVYKFAGDCNHPPYEYVDCDGDYKGFNIDIMNAISNVKGLDIEIIPMEWGDRKSVV